MPSISITAAQMYSLGVFWYASTGPKTALFGPLMRSNAMGFYEILDQVVDLLRRRGRVTYRALKREFQVDDAFLEDLKAEIISAQRLAIDEEGTVLVWVGEAGTPPAPQADAHSPQGEPRV